MGGNQIGWAMGWGWLFLALVVIGVIALVVALVRLTARGDRGPVPTARGRARDVLDERYARGEIDTADYDERRRRLDGDEDS